MATDKTNAMRILDRAKLPYEIHVYQGDGAVDGMTAAAKMGQPTERVFKTLVTLGAGGGHYVFVIPVALELDLKAAAKSVGEKWVEMIHVSELFGLTGYVRGGCSPIGMKKAFPTVVDSSCLHQPTIIFSAGKIGRQIEMEPQGLLTLIGARTGEVAHCPHGQGH